MKQYAIILPKRETMLERLCAVSNDPQLCEGFYPFFLEHEDTQKEPDDIVHLFKKAIWGFFVKCFAHPATIHEIYRNGDSYIDALISDEASATRTKMLWAKTLRY